ncbi:uncharacterized protein PAF06_012038 [Gastrophryne carolinensis]
MEEPQWRPGRAEGHRCELAAFLQAVALVFSCLALSDPAWLLVRVDGAERVYGVSYFLHQGFNFTEPGAPQLLHKQGLYLLALVGLCCYTSILIGSVAFLFDFVPVCSRGMLGKKISSVLHAVTVVSSATSVALCTYLFIVLRDEVDLLVTKLPGKFVRLGDSYYFAIGAFLASLCAAMQSCYYAHRRYRPDPRSEDPASHTNASTPLLQEPESPDTPEEYG